MKVVIEHLITHYFLGLTNQWNPNIEDARLFESPEQALWFSFKKLRTPYNVVLRLKVRNMTSPFQPAKIPQCLDSASKRGRISPRRIIGWPR